MNCSPPGSFIHGILKARNLEWVAIPFSRGSSQPRDPTWVSGIAGRRLYCLSHQGRPYPPLPCSYLTWLISSIQHSDLSLLKHFLHPTAPHWDIILLIFLPPHRLIHFSLLASPSHKPDCHILGCSLALCGGKSSIHVFRISLQSRLVK